MVFIVFIVVVVVVVRGMQWLLAAFKPRLDDRVFSKLVVNIEQRRFDSLIMFLFSLLLLLFINSFSLLRFIIAIVVVFCDDDDVDDKCE